MVRVGRERTGAHSRHTGRFVLHRQTRARSVPGRSERVHFTPYIASPRHHLELLSLKFHIHPVIHPNYVSASKVTARQLAQKASQCKLKFLKLKRAPCSDFRSYPIRRAEHPAGTRRRGTGTVNRLEALPTSVYEVMNSMMMQ